MHNYPQQMFKKPKAYQNLKPNWKSNISTILFYNNFYTYQSPRIYNISSQNEQINSRWNSGTQKVR